MSTTTALEPTLEEEAQRRQQLDVIRTRLAHPDWAVDKVCRACGISRSTYYRWQGQLAQILQDLLPDAQVQAEIQYAARELLYDVIDVAKSILHGQGGCAPKASDQLKAAHLLVQLANLSSLRAADDPEEATEFLHRLGRGGNVFIQNVHVIHAAEGPEGPPADVVDGAVRQLP